MLFVIAAVFIAIAIGLIASAMPITKAQLVILAQNAGFSESEANTAAAIALAESGGNPHAYNAEEQASAPPGKGSFGLWQIYLNAHPEFFNVPLYDAQTNANAAFKVYTEAGNSFSPWSTYKNGAYEQYL
jgi:hypothetical protein